MVLNRRNQHPHFQLSQKKAFSKHIKWPIISFVAIFVVVVSTQIPSVAIYADFFQVKEYRFTTYSPPTIYFHNNNFLSAVSFTPLFYGSVRIVDSTGNVECYYDISKDRPCDKMRMDLGMIESGKNSVLPFYLYPNNNDFVIKATPYLNFFNQAIELPSASWDCKHTEGEFYWCTSST